MSGERRGGGTVELNDILRAYFRNNYLPNINKFKYVEEIKRRIYPA